MIAWALGWTNAKIVGEYLSFNNLVFFRFLLSFIILVPFIVIKKITLPNVWDLWYVIVSGTLFLFYNIFFFKGTYYGLASKGGVLVTTLNPLFTILIISLINKKIIIKEVFGIVLGIIGGIIIMDLYVQGLGSMLDSNNIYFILCAITWGLMTVSVSYAQKVINPYMFICLCYLYTTILSLPFIDLNELSSAELDIRFYVNFFFVSIVTMSFGTSVYIYSTPILGPAKSSVFIFSVPFVAVIFAYIFLGEPLTTNVVIGGLLSILAIYIVNK